ncbi:MAG: MBL fold metallo-hydrolase, partial [Chitinophagia bacterium]|nr:MBL fold metallo-hydrolase [Chitinophagia bacterium]
LGTGTSGGVPMIGCTCEVCTSTDPRDNRLRSSILIETDSTRVVIDTGPDFRLQMLRTAIRHLDAVVFTHPHKDHTAGLDDVRAFNFFSGRSMAIYANNLTADTLRSDYHYAFAEDRYPGTPDLDLHIIGREPFHIGDMEFQPIEVRHMKMPVLGFRIGDVTYITDANHIEAAEMDRIRGSRLLVLNALRRQRHVSHYCLEEALAVTSALGVPMARFTHISHQMGLHARVDSELPEGMGLAYDGLQLNV